jgi:hemolysin activation/secretion protein
VGGADEQDYMHRLGGSARVVVVPMNGLSLDVGYAAARERSAFTDADFSLFGDMGKSNPPVDEGDDQALVAGIRVDAPNWLSVELAQRVAGGSMGGDFRYNRTDMTIHAHGFPIGRQELDLTLKGVTTGDNPPLQRLADVGGLSTVRGYDRRTHVGNHSFAARLEYLVPYDLLKYTHIPLLDDSKIQFVPWGDAARVGEGDTQDWISSAGIGLQRYLWPIEEAANLRLDFAFPFDNDAEDMVVYLWFNALF